jgi:AcrR family transcriptional regulator
MGRKNIQQERRLQIIKALNRCLMKKPYRETTIKDIAGEAGINHGMLHYYFKDKEEILLQFMDHVLDAQKTKFLQWRNEQEFGEAGKQQIMEKLLEYVNDKITLNRTLAKLFIILWELSLDNRKVKAKLKRVYQEWIDITVDTMESAGQTINREFAFSLVAYLEGMALFSILFNQKKPDHRRLLQNFEQVVMKGLFE